MINTLPKTLDLKAEALLDASIQFQNPLADNFLEPKSIFLTGATGFLGVCLLNELLHKTTANIYCLIRCNNSDNGKERLQESLEFYSLWKETFSFRIIPVVGDLAKPLFALSQAEFEQLAEIIDVIYHNGAWVNSARPYSTLKPVNVLGTQEVLRLASLRQTKPVHFTSTLGVFFSQSHFSSGTVTETDSPDFSNLRGGYTQSKWVAEQLIIQAQQRGLPTSIYRTSRIIGHSQTGINGNFQDLLCIFLKACIHLGKFPNLDSQINVIPVDYVSQAMVGLSQKKQSSNKLFHLTNPQSIPWENFFHSIEALGYSLEKVSYDDFLGEVNRQLSHDPKNKLYLSILFPLRRKMFVSEKIKFDAHQTFTELKDISIICPSVNEELLNLYFSYFQKIGYFPARV